MREQIYADLPQELRQAEELLKAYGRWAKDRHKPHTCGSAEGRYKPEEEEEKPAPKDEGIPKPDEVVKISRALLAVPELERQVLMALYVPRREPVMAWLRRHKIPPRVSRERHAAGVRMFWNVYQRANVAKEQLLKDTALY